LSREIRSLEVPEEVKQEVDMSVKLIKVNHRVSEEHKLYDYRVHEDSLLDYRLLRELTFSGCFLTSPKSIYQLQIHLGMGL